MNYDVLRMMDNIAVSEIGVDDTLQINLKNRARELQASYRRLESRICTYFLNYAREEIGLGKWRSVTEIIGGRSPQFSCELETFCSFRLPLISQYWPNILKVRVALNFIAGASHLWLGHDIEQGLGD